MLALLFSVFLLAEEWTFIDHEDVDNIQVPAESCATLDIQDGWVCELDDVLCTLWFDRDMGILGTWRYKIEREECDDELLIKFQGGQWGWKPSEVVTVIPLPQPEAHVRERAQLWGLSWGEAPPSLVGIPLD